MASSRPVAAGDHVFLVDGSSFIFRAYFQSMNQDSKYNTRISDGMPTGAVRLFVTKLLQFIREGAAGLKPTHLAIVLDKSEGSFRKELYEDYKGHRPDPPSDLIVQMPLMREAIRAFGLEPIELERYEADDLIATYTQEAKARGANVLIISSDKDLMQLVGPLVCFYDFESGAKGKPGYRPERNLDEAAVMEKWEGLPPEKIGDLLALMGDASDNVPGVPGIGLKTAAQLIKEFGDLETLLERAYEIKQPKRRETLIANADMARLSKKLVTLDCEAPLPVPLDALPVPDLDAKALIGFLKAMEFNTITRRVADLYNADSAMIEPDPRLMPGGQAIRWERPGGARERAAANWQRRLRATMRLERSVGTPSRTRRAAGNSRLLATLRHHLLRYDHQPRSVGGMGRAGSRAGLCGARHRNQCARSQSCRSGRDFPRAPARARGLCAAAASRRFRSFRRRHGAGADRD